MSATIMSHNSALDVNPSIAESSAANAESLGAWLARTRTEQGADLRETARRLGLNPVLIQALEENDFERLGAPVFVRGYLSRYARLLELPEQAVLDRYRRQSGIVQEPPPLKVVLPRRRQTQVRDLRGLLYLLIVIGIGWSAVQGRGALDWSRLSAWWSDLQKSGGVQTVGKPITVTTQTQYPFQPKPDAATHEPEPPSAPAVREPSPAPHAEPSEAASAIALTTTPAPLPHAEPEPAAVSTAPGATLSATATVSATVSGGDGSSPDTRSDARLMLQFSEDCWVEVKDVQGKVLANGLMKANTTHEIAGPAPFTVTLGNAPAARIALDDRFVDTAVYVPRRGTVSRFTLNPQP